MTTAEQPTSFASLRDYLAGRKQASVENPPSADSCVPDDGSKPVTTGARFSENTSDVAKMPPGKNVEHQAGTARNGETKPTDSVLEQTIAGEEDSQTRAIKTVTDENEKMSGLDPTKDADLDKLMAGLAKAAAALPKLVAASGVKRADEQTTKLSAEDEKASADHQAVVNVIETYRKAGVDRGRVTAAYLSGFDQTYRFLKQAMDEGSLAQLLQGDAGAGDPNAMAGPGGDVGAQMPPMAPPPEAAAGGAPGGEPTMSDDDLAAAFAEAGVTPEEFVQMLMEMKAQMGGGEAPPAEAPAASEGTEKEAPMPADEKAAAIRAIDDGIKIASHVIDYKKTGKFSFKPAADGTPERKGRDQMKQYLRELRNASV